MSDEILWITFFVLGFVGAWGQLIGAFVLLFAAARLKAVGVLIALLLSIIGTLFLFQRSALKIDPIAFTYYWLALQVLVAGYGAIRLRVATNSLFACGIYLYAASAISRVLIEVISLIGNRSRG